MILVRLLPLLPLLACLGCAHPSTLSNPPAAAASLTGDWQGPEGHEVWMRFTPAGQVAVAVGERSALDSAKTTGTWLLEGSRLTFVNRTGSCADSPATQTGVYEVALAAGSVRFHKLEDACDRRASIDGETWTRRP